MIARPENCDSSRLSLMLEDALTVNEQLDVTQHLDHCPKCREQLEQLTAEQSWWSDTQAALRDQSDTLFNSTAAMSWQPLGTLKSSPDASITGTYTGPMMHNVASDSRPNSLAPDPLDAAGQSSAADATREQVVHQSVAQDHWVMALLSPTEDSEALGQVDAMPIYSVVGQGGMGVVLKARDTNLHRFLAVKLLSPMLSSSGAARQRFLREAQAAAAIVHPNIVPIYAVSADRQLPYLVMPFVAGGNLQQHLDESGPLPLDRTLSIGLQVAEGLSAAHRQGIVHRDIKPANLMFDEGGFRVMLTDFGLARALDDATLTASGMVAGTPQFMSPEQSRGQSVDHRSDIYSLGAVLYALATGRPPVRGDSTLDVLRRISEDQPVSVLELNECYPSWYQRLIELLMAKEASQRPQAADEVAELLRSCLAHARRPQRATLPQQLQVKKRWLPLFIAASLLCATSFAIGLVVRSQGMSGHSPDSNAESGVGAVDSPLGSSNPFPALEEKTASTGYATAANNTEYLVPVSDDQEHWDAADLELKLTKAEEELQSLQAELEGWSTNGR